MIAHALRAKNQSERWLAFLIGAGGYRARAVESSPHRILLIAAAPAVGEELREALQPHLRDRAEIFLVAPALVGTAFQHAMGDVDDAIKAAEERLAESVRTMRDDGLLITGEVGDSDPAIAIEDALVRFEADEIVLVTRPEDQARWLEGDLFDRARRKFEPEITHISLRRHEGEVEVEDVEASGPGADPPPDDEFEPESRNMPKLSVRDLFGILVAVVGTLVLVVLAGQCEGEEAQRNAGAAGIGSDGACVARYIIAGVTALINIAHVVGLVLFQSVRYRGGLERFFAVSSLYGTPLAIVASLLVK